MFWVEISFLENWKIVMNEINVESLSNGTYFIYLNHGSENQIYQVIISR